MAKDDKKAKAPVVQGGTVKAGDGKTYTKKLVTLPHRKFQDNVPMRVELLCPLYKGQQELDRKTGKPKLDEEGQPKKPVDLVKCKSLDDGVQHTIICGAVLAERLREEYPNDSYVGKAFEFTQHKIEGKRWKDYAISELEAA